jgi:cytochrome bd ubiquinol oxidase subunit II
VTAAEILLAILWVGLTLYAVLGGADFGAGFWDLFAGWRGGPGRGREHRGGTRRDREQRGREQRDLIAHVIGPVWEANHVWLIFVLVLLWTGFSPVFAAVMSTLYVPLTLVALGIIVRGAAFAFRKASDRERLFGAAFAVASLLTPYFLGAVAGAVASGRVPPGLAAGDLVTSWLNPTSILIGVLAVVTAAYLAAVFLAADAVRLGKSDLTRAFRVRALGTGVVAGAIALGGLAVLKADVPSLYHGLVNGDGLVALVVSILAGVTTLGLVWVGHYEPARYGAAAAVAAIIAGWGLAQRPTLLPGLTIQQAAAPDDTLIAIVVAVVVGAAILFPSLGLLFKLVLGGRLDHAESTPTLTTPGGAVLSASAPGLLARSAGACFVAGLGFLTAADADWAHAIGIASLFGFIVLGFLAVAPSELARAEAEERETT